MDSSSQSLDLSHTKLKLNSQNNSIENHRIGLNQEESLDPSKIGEYIQLLQDFEKNCISEGNFKEAEVATRRIEELQQHELVYRSLAVVERNKIELQELEKLNLEQFKEFNQAWEKAIEEHVEHLKQLEDNMLVQHEHEMQNFNEELEKIEIPKCKFSRDILNMRYVMENLIKTKKYQEAHDLREKIQNQEKIEEKKWNASYMEKFEKKRKLLINKHKNELQALKVKLENSFQEKIKIRTQELEKLLQKFQNMKKELENKQNQEMSKLQVMNSKTLTKIQSNRPNISHNSSVYQLNSQDQSKFY